jgi:hypothetical protein
LYANSASVIAFATMNDDSPTLRSPTVPVLPQFPMYSFLDQQGLIKL